MLIRFLSSIVLAAVSAHVLAIEPAELRTQFQAAHKLAKAGLPWRTVAPELASYPLLPYLEHAELMRTPRPTSDALAAFVERHGDQPLTRPLRSTLIARRVQAKDWAGVQALDVPSLSFADRCHQLRAAVELGQGETHREAIRAVWLNAKLLPSACHPLDHWLRAQKLLDADTVWQRVELAVAAHQIGLLRQLATDLAAKDKAAVLHLADLLADSGRARQNAKSWPDDAAHRRALALGLARIAARDDALAAALWREFSARFKFEDAEKYRVIDAIALYRANSFEADAESWLDLLPAGQDSAATREWRLREALSRRDLADAQAAIDRFDATQLADPSTGALDRNSNGQCVLDRIRRDAARVPVAWAGLVVTAPAHYARSDFERRRNAHCYGNGGRCTGVTGLAARSVLGLAVQAGAEPHRSRDPPLD